MKGVQLSSTPWCQLPSHSWPPTWWTLLPRTVCKSLVCAEHAALTTIVIIMLWSLPKVKVKSLWITYFSWHDAVLTTEIVKYVLSLIVWCSMYSKILKKCRSETLHIESHSWHNAVLSVSLPGGNAILLLLIWCMQYFYSLAWRNTLTADMMQYYHSLAWSNIITHDMM